MDYLSFPNFLGKYFTFDDVHFLTRRRFNDFRTDFVTFVALVALL